MSNESSDRNDREIATSTFEDWLAQKAAETDSSQERVLEQLLDSYWTLKEITQVLDGRNRTPLFSDGDRPAEADRQGPTALTDGAVTEDEFDELRQHVESLQSELQTESQQRSALTEGVQSLAERVEDVEAASEDVDELADTVADVRSTFETEHAQLQARLDDEFENLQTILEYLVETSDELDVRLTETEIQYRAEIRELRAKRDQLRRLREAAREVGTHTADCEQCGDTVDFALLTSPECPNCGRVLTGVTEETNWFVLSTYTATTGGSPGGNRAKAANESDSEKPPDRDGEAESPQTTDDGVQTDTEPTVTESRVNQQTDSTSPNESDFEWLS